MKKVKTYKITDPRFIYVDSAATDIRKTFAKYGWTPPSTRVAPRRAPRTAAPSGGGARR